MGASVQATVAALVAVFNLRHTITRLKLEGEELAKYGPAKHPHAQGIDTYADAPVQQGEHYCMDPTGRRTGNGECVSCGGGGWVCKWQQQQQLTVCKPAAAAACDPELAKKLLQELEAAAAAASKVRRGDRMQH